MPVMTINTEEELINDLILQIESNKSSPSSTFALKISNCEINFTFDFENILKELGITEKDEDNLVCPYNISFMNTTFNQDVDFRGITFSNYVLFHFIIFSRDVLFNDMICEQNVNFINTAFNQDVDFTEAAFGKRVYFLETIFSQEVLFENIKFEQTIIFDNIKINADKSSLIFSDINYNYRTPLYVPTPKDSTIEIINTVINGRIDFSNVHIAKLNLEGSNVTGILNRIDLKAESENWETACILKNEELKRNNTIKALEYQAEEKKLYTEELWKNKQWRDWFSLWLGKIFHNHGQDWVLALGWTMFILTLSFTCFYLPNPFEYWSIWAYKISNGIYFSELFKYLVPTDYKQIQDYFIMKELSFCTKLLGTFWYMIGKMVLPYGIYEVIKAFRKYK